MTRRGPTRSCQRPPAIVPRPRNARASCGRAHPSRSMSGFTNTLQPYTAPRQIWVATAATATVDRRATGTPSMPASFTRRSDRPRPSSIGETTDTAACELGLRSPPWRELLGFSRAGTVPHRRGRRVRGACVPRRAERGTRTSHPRARCGRFARGDRATCSLSGTNRARADAVTRLEVALPLHLRVECACASTIRRAPRGVRARGWHTCCPRKRWRVHCGATVQANHRGDGGHGMARLRIVLTATSLATTVAIISLARGDDHEEKAFKAKNESGVARTINVGGFPVVASDNPFFLDLGTNGRRCVTCHQPANNMTVSAASVADRFEASDGKDPIFRPNDGA